MYESPISITEQVTQNLVGTLNNDFETQVMMEVQRCVKVDKEELIKALEYDRWQYDKGYADGQRDAVVHGHWAEWDDTMFNTVYRCSVCGEDFVLIDGTPSDNLYNYCPNCGAKMDEN